MFYYFDFLLIHASWQLNTYNLSKKIESYLFWQKLLIKWFCCLILLVVGFGLQFLLLCFAPSFFIYFICIVDLVHEVICYETFVLLRLSFSIALSLVTMNRIQASILNKRSSCSSLKILVFILLLMFLFLFELFFSFLV